MPNPTPTNPANERLQIVGSGSVPGSSTFKPASGGALESHYFAGDVYSTDANGNKFHRAEVLDRLLSNTPAADQPDPPGSERWYAWSLYVPSSFDLTTYTGSNWFSTTQFKGGGSSGGPPESVLIDVDASGGPRFRLGGSNSDNSPRTELDLGTLTRGAWTRFVVGMKLSTTFTGTDAGWVEVYRDGQTTPVLARTARATMLTDANGTVPLYFKQGIYRSGGWDLATHDLFYGPPKIGDTRASVETP